MGYVQFCIDMQMGKKPAPIITPQMQQSTSPQKQKIIEMIMMCDCEIAIIQKEILRYLSILGSRKTQSKHRVWRRQHLNYLQNELVVFQTKKSALLVELNLP